MKEMFLCSEIRVAYQLHTVEIQWRHFEGQIHEATWQQIHKCQGKNTSQTPTSFSISSTGLETDWTVSLANNRRAGLESLFSSSVP